MLFQHQWSPAQCRILQALKKLLSEKKFYACWGGPADIQQGMLLMMKHLNMEPDLPLIWQKTFKRKSSQTTNYIKLLIGQAAAALFSDPQKIHIKDPAVGAAISLFFGFGQSPYDRAERKYIPGCDLPNELIAPAKEGDLAKLTFLLDVAVDREKACEELAIFLLNEKNYPLIMTLAGVKEHLNKIPQKHLREHWLKLAPAVREERDFLYYVFPLLEKKSDLLYTINQNVLLHRRITDLLMLGVSPDALILDRNALKITLRQYIYFLDEISSELKEINVSDTGKMKKHLAAIPKFINFIQEKENK